MFEKDNKLRPTSQQLRPVLEVRFNLNIKMYLFSHYINISI